MTWAEGVHAGAGVPGTGERATLAWRQALLASVALLPLSHWAAAAQPAPAPQAVPTGGRVVAGQASIAAPAPGQLTITQTTQRAAIDWQGFSVGTQGHVQFQQPNSAAIALNRVTGPDASVIAGRISANGQVAIVNQSGVVFTPTARVDVGALVASAAGISNENFMAGRMVFDQPARPGARVVNEGRITVAEGGLAALVAPEAANRGTIEARLGRVVIGGAETYALDLHGDGLLSLEVRQPSRHVGGPAAANTGTITAEGGTVLITAEAAGQLVQSLVEAGGTVAAREGGRIAVAAPGGEARVTGTLDARSATGRGGDIAVTGRQVAVAQAARIDASGGAGGGRVRVGGDVLGQGTLPRATRTGVAPGATIAADATVAGNGGTVVVWADDAAFVHGRLSARGGPQGGDGGLVETSGLRVLSLAGVSVDTSGPAGRAGTWLIDPIDLTITDVTSGGIFNGTSFSPDVDINSATLAASDIVAGLATNNVQITTAAGSGVGTGSLTVSEAITWTTATTLTLDALSSLTISAPISGTAGSLVLSAGAGQAISQAPTAPVSVAQLSVTASGSISLGSAGNAIASVGTLASTGAITLASSVPMTLTTAVTAGGALSLAAPTLVTQALSVPNGSTITLTADSLTLAGVATATAGRVILAPRAAGAPVSVGGAGPGLVVSDTLLNQVATDTGTLQIGNGAGTGAITIAAQTVIAAPIATTLDLRGAGAITQTGRIVVARLAASGASVALTDTENAVSRLGASSTSGGALAITAKTPDNAALVVDGPISASGALSLTAAASGLTLAATLGATGTVSLAAEGTITQSAAITAPALTASVTGAGSAIVLDAATNAVGSLAGVTVGAGGGGLSFATSTALSIDGAIVVPGAVTLTAGGGVSQAAGITAASLGVTAGAGGIVLDSAANAFGTLSGAASAGGPVTVETAGTLAITGAVSGTGVTLRSTGDDVTTTAGGSVTATAGTATITGATTVTLAGAVAGSGGVSISTTAGTVQTAAVSSSGGAVTVEGDAVTAGAITAFGPASLTARTGTLALTAGASADSVTLLATGGSITAAGAVVATGGAAGVTAGQDITLAAVSGATGVTIDAAGDAATAAVTSSGDAVAIAGNTVTTGALTADTTVTVTARNGGDVILTGAVSADTVTLSSTTGGIIATAAAPIAATAGATTLTAQGGITLGAATAGRDGVTLRSTAGDVSTAGLGASDGAIVAEGRVVNLGAATASGAVTVAATTAAVIASASAGADVSLTAPGLTVSGPVSAGTGRTLGIVADTVAVGGTLGAAGGTVSFRTVTPGRAITLGDAGTGLSLTAGTLGLISAGSGTLRIGAADAGAISLAGPVDLTGRAARLVLVTGAGVSQAASLTVGRLAVTAGDGIALGLTTNAIGTVEGAQGTGAVSLATASALSLEGNVTGNGVTLFSGGPLSLTAPVNAGAGALALTVTGAVTQAAAGTVTAGALTGSAASLSLAAAANAVGTLGPFAAATGDIALATTGPLALAGAITTPGTLALTIPGAVSADPGLSLTAARLSGSASGGTDLGTTAHAVGSLGAWSDATGGLAMRAAGALAIVGDVALGGPLALTAGGAITQAGGTTITATSLTGGAAGGAALASATNTIAALGPWADTTGGLTLATTGPLAVNGAVTLGGTLDLTAASITQAAAGAVTAPRVTASAANGITLAAPGNAIPVFGQLRATGGDISLATTTALLLDGAVEANGRLSLTSGGTITQAAPVTAARLAAEATGGITLGNAGNAIGALDDVTNATAGSTTLRTSTALAIDERVFTPASLVIEAGGAVSQGAGGAVEAATLSGRSAGGLTLDRPANRVAALTGWTNTGGGGLSLVTGSALTVTGAVTTAGGGMLLETRGAFTLTIDTPLASDVSLTGLSGGTISLGNHRYAAPRIAFRARGAAVPMEVTDGVFAATDSVVLAATGSMQFSGTTRVEPLAPGNRPAVVLSIRSGDEQTDAARVRPDTPGLPDLLQFTQVERFVPPTGAARNTLTLGGATFNAPASPLFLVIDGGTVTGRIDVARLGLVTLGGSADLAGCVNGVCGPNAASLGRSTDPSSLARLNNCPVSSTNCLDFPTTVAFVTTTPPELPQVVTERRFEGVEIPLSDVADEDE